MQFVQAQIAVEEINEMEQGSVVHRHLSFHLLREITNSFSGERKLGRGAYGTVYKGECEDGETIAVKVFHEILGFDDEQFDKEYLNLASVQHKNIVRVVAYCHETRRECVQYNGRTVLADNIKRAICFEYLQNGCLDNYLSDESSGHDWETRYNIIKGICEGMKYLHEDLDSPMYHLDLKPANVLLDQNLVPKLADFGLSRLIAGDNTQQTNSVIGTRGYQPPEYIDSGIISNKFDIYSLGVVIIKIMTGPMGYFRTAEMSSQDFIELVHANWRNRLLATSIHTLESSSQQVKRCIELALSCVAENRHERPSMGVIINKLIETEDMIRIPGESRRDTGSSMTQICDSESSTRIPHVNRLLPVYDQNDVTVSRDHIVFLFHSRDHRLSNLTENPWILQAGTETFADPCELTNELTGTWVMKLITTAEFVGLSNKGLQEEDCFLCEVAREKCVEQLLEVAYSISDAGWSVGQISHQLTIFDALVRVLFNIHSIRSCEVAGILNKMVNAFKAVMQQTSNHISRSTMYSIIEQTSDSSSSGEEFTIHSTTESAIHPATVVLIHVLEFFSRNREMVQTLLESGNCDADPCSDIINSWACKVNENAEIMFQEKGRRYIYISSNTYYVLGSLCRPGLLLPSVVSNLRSLIHQYTTSYLDEYWVPPVLLYLDGDSLKKPLRSSLDNFFEEFFSICDRQMTWKVQTELKFILRNEIVELVVPKYVNFLAALPASTSVPWMSWLKGKSRRRSKKQLYTGGQLEEVIRSLFDG